MEIIKIKNSEIGQFVDNNEFEKTIDTNDEWIVKRTGISTRFVSKLNCYQAIENMMNQFTKEELSQIDLIVVTSMSNLNLAPSLSAYASKFLPTQREVLSLDINAGCSGYVYGIEVVDKFLKTNDYKNALLLTVEIMQDIIDYKDRTTCILFGDGITATLVASNRNLGIISEYNKSSGNIQPLNCLKKQKLQMHGQDVFKFAIRAVIDTIDNLLIKSNLKIEEIDNFYFHQANIRIIQTIIKRYGLDEKKVYSNLDHYANTSSSTIPLLIKDYPIKKGQKSIMIGFGAGLSYGGVIYQS